MTLVFDRGALPNNKAVTHAFVIGCGRFPHLPNLDRPATVAGARAVMRFLSLEAEKFIAPIWTIRCLLSDPAVATGMDLLGVDLHNPDPVGTFAGDAALPVDAATLAHVDAEGGSWLDSFDVRPGDSALFYMSTHGVAEFANALGLCEDVRSNRRKKWAQSLNVSTLAFGIRALDVERGWLFFDACQEVVPNLFGRITGVPGLHLIEPDTASLTKGKTAVAIAGSKYGGQAWAPNGPEAPYFTQALLEGLANACVEPVQGLGWAVTGRMLSYELPAVARITLGHKTLKTEALTGFNETGIGLIQIDQPQLPIALQTEVELDLLNALIAVNCDDATIAPIFSPNPNADIVWRFRVEAHKKRTYTAIADFPGEPPRYHPTQFDPDPPGQWVVMRSMP